MFGEEDEEASSFLHSNEEVSWFNTPPAAPSSPLLSSRIKQQQYVIIHYVLRPIHFRHQNQLKQTRETKLQTRNIRSLRSIHIWANKFHDAKREFFLSIAHDQQIERRFVC
jgi:hypothetical protein